MKTVVLGLGSNKGRSEAILRDALSRLHSILHAMQVSSLYKTKPQDYLLQADFLNLVAAGGYGGSAEQLLAAIQAIEAAYGRNRQAEIPKGPRYLDIDIIFFGTDCIRTPSLTVPHPALKKRCFVLIPLLELFPHYTDPVTGEPLQTALHALPDQGVMRIGAFWNA